MTMDPFQEEVQQRLDANADNAELRKTADAFMLASTAPKYSYNFSWMGRPIIQYPQDMVAVQELIWSIQPELIIETGIAHGGSLIFSAAMLELNAACGGPADAQVLGIDIDIRAHNRAAILAHPMNKRITMFEGSSIAPDMVAGVKAIASAKARVLVMLDSNHTHEHVLAELEAYAPLTTVGSYCVVFDTIVEHLPPGMYPGRTWGPGDNPLSALKQYLSTHTEFEIDTDIDHKLLISVAPSGYLKRVR